MAAALTRCTARAGRYHATNSPGANLDSFSWPRSGEPHGGGEQSSTPRTPTPATALRWWHCSGLSLPTALRAVGSQRPKLLPAVLSPCYIEWAFCFIRYAGVLHSHGSHSAVLVALCRPSLACIASRPACGSPTSFLTKLSPCFIVLRPNCLCTKRQAKRVHHTQTPVRPPYRSHPVIVIEKIKPNATKDLSQRAIATISRITAHFD